MFASTDREIDDALEAHKDDINQWASEISFRDMNGKKKLDDVYVPLNLYVSQRRSRLDINEDQLSIGMDELLSREMSHTIIFGHPGAGKTTSLKHVCRRFVGDAQFLPALQRLILIRLGDLNSKTYVLIL